MKKLFLMLILLLFAGCLFEADPVDEEEKTEEEKKTAGTVDDVETAGVARIYEPDGRLAAAAKVSVYGSSDTSRTAEKVVFANDKGEVSFEGLKKGTYNIWMEKKDLVAFQDSVLVTGDSVFFQDDTLESALTLEGYVRIQRNHDPRNVTVQVLGTHLYSNVDENGKFTVEGIARGKYSLRVSTDLEHYVDTYKQIEIKAGPDGTLKDTIDVIYTGIPLVENIRATYDTASGAVHLEWDPTDYKKIEEYAIYRSVDGVVDSKQQIVGRTADTLFKDTVYREAVRDSIGKSYRYIVKIIDKSGEEGVVFGYSKVAVVSPIVLETGFRFWMGKLKKSAVKLPEVYRLFLDIQNKARKISKLYWYEESVIIDSVVFSKPVNEFRDTLVIPFEENISKIIRVKTVDVTGYESSEAEVLSSPLVEMARHSYEQKTDGYFEVSPSKSLLSMNGFVVENFPEWADFDPVTGKISGTPDSSDLGMYENVKIRLIGEYFYGTTKPFSIEVYQDPWKKLAEMGASRRNFSAAYYDSKIYVTGGVANNMEVYDVKSNTWTEGLPMSQNRSGHSSIVYQGEMFVFGGDSMDSSTIEAYSIRDNKWRHVTRYPHFRKNETVCFGDSVVYVFGGSASSVHSYNLNTNVWKADSAIPLGILKFLRFRSGNGSCQINDGLINVLAEENIVQYDIGKQEWSYKKSNKVLSYNGGYVWIGGSAWEFGGLVDGKVKTEILQIDPVTQKIKAHGDIPKDLFGIYHHSVVLGDGSFYVIGGYKDNTLPTMWKFTPRKDILPL